MTDQALYNEANGPTPEHRAKIGANMAVGKTGERKGIPQIRYRNLYELVADPEKDMLKESYGDCVSRLVAARYAYLLSQRANHGKASETSGSGDADSMPLADFYLALQRRFHEQKSACNLAGHRVDHWTTIMMLLEELPAGMTADAIEKNRSALLKLVPDIEGALDLLSEYSETISRSYRDRIEAEKEPARL